jgi:hypothetical protein
VTKKKVKKKQVSSFELLLAGSDKVKVLDSPPLYKGSLCPRCRKGKLDYNGLLQLECPKCGFVSSEGGGCT